MPVIVETSAQIFATFDATLTSTDGGNDISVHIELTDPSGNTILASEAGETGAPIRFYDGNYRSFAQRMSTASVLHAGADSLDSSASAYVVLPGSYLLRVQGGMTPPNCGVGESFEGPKLTYILLSAVSDRIYANGFGLTG